MKSVKNVMKILIMIIFIMVIIKNINTDIKSKNICFRDSIYGFLQDEENRIEAYSSAVDLHNGSSENTCVYFIAEVLRKNNVIVPKDTCNTAQLISFLQRKGWNKDTDYRNLRPGDICFTTDDKGKNEGDPTHTYIFMSWVNEGSYDYAYICDNQAKDYENKVYHVRNIKNRVTYRGQIKDAFSFFMKAS